MRLFPRQLGWLGTIRNLLGGWILKLTRSLRFERQMLKSSSQASWCELSCRFTWTSIAAPVQFNVRCNSPAAVLLRVRFLRQPWLHWGGLHEVKKIWAANFGVLDSHHIPIKGRGDVTRTLALMAHTTLSLGLSSAWWIEICNECCLIIQIDENGGNVLFYTKGGCKHSCIFLRILYSCNFLPCPMLLSLLPVVPHKALAEVSKIGTCRGGELLWCINGRANPLMDWKVVGVVLLGVVAMVSSPTAAGCSVL